MSGVETASRTRYAQSDGVEIAYQAIGDGPNDIVLVPGLLSHMSLWWEQPAFAELFDGVASRARVILFDRRGSGLSGGEGVPTIDERMRDVEAVMDAAGASRATIVGPSEGAPAAALFASTRPERCRGLVLYGTQATGLRDDDYPWGVDAEEHELMLKSVALDWGSGGTLHMYAPSLAGDEGAVRWWAEMERDGVGAAHVVSAMRTMAATDFRDLLPAIPVPTLVAHCVGDFAAPIDGARWMAERIPGARLAELPGADHLPVLSAGSALVEEMDAFVERVTDAGPSHDRVAAVVAVASADGHRVHRSVRAFDGPVAAVTHALAVREDARLRGEEVRVGVHLDCTWRCEEELMGPAVDTALRLTLTAGEHEVLVTRAVRGLLAPADIELEPRGRINGGSLGRELPVFAVV